MLEEIRVWLGKARFRFASRARARLWDRISSLADGGVPIHSAMDFLADSRQLGPAAGFVAHQRDAIRSSEFARAAEGWAPKEELVIIALAAADDRIAEGLRQASRIASVRARLRSTLISGLAYPSILILISGTVVAILPPYALRAMHDILDFSKWPPVSRSVLYFSEFMQHWGIVVLIGFTMLVAASIWAAPRWTGPIRLRMEWHPPFAIYRQLSGPEVLVAWLALMRAGIPKVPALEQLEKGLPKYLASHVRTMRSRMYSGAPIEVAMDTGLFSVETLDDLRIYDHIGQFNEQFDRIAAEDIERALQRLEASTRTVSAFMLLLIAAIAIWIYLGIARIAFSLQQSAYF